MSGVEGESHFRCFGPTFDCHASIKNVGKTIILKKTMNLFKKNIKLTKNKTLISHQMS